MARTTNPEDLIRRMMEMIDPEPEVVYQEQRNRRKKQKAEPVQKVEAPLPAPVMAKPAPPAELEEISDDGVEISLDFNRDSLLQGIIFATVLSPPPGRRRKGMPYGRRGGF